jgi:CBS domain-containing protein
MLVHEAMTPHAEWITPETTLQAAAQRMRDQDIGCLPIGKDDRLVGMVTDRDLACRAIAQALDARTNTVADVMTKGITWCFDDETVDDVLDRMEQKQIHHIPVLNRQKRMIGILSLSDLGLRAPQALSAKLFKLASRDATRHAAHPH